MSMTANKKWITLVTLCSFFVGILLMFQFRAQTQAVKTVPGDNVLATLAPYAAEIEQLQLENDKLRTELSKYKEGTDAALLADERLNKAKVLAGLTPVVGPGWVIILSDSEREVKDKNNIDKYIIHEQYLTGIVNSLWNAGAEAIAINGQRITANSEIFCAGNNISINGAVETQPFKIEAIGDVQKLGQGLKFYNNYVYTLDSYHDQFGIGFTMASTKELSLPAAGLPTFQYASPVKEGN